MRPPRLIETIATAVAAFAVVAVPIIGAAQSATAANTVVVVSSVDFEDGTKGTWSQSGNPTYGFVADGSKVLSVSNRVNSWDTISSPTGLLEAGTEYTLSMRVKLASGAAATQAHFTAADGSYSWIAPTPVNAAGWTTVTGKYTLPAGAAAATTKVSVEVDAVGGVLPSFFVDDILITKPAPAPVTPTVTTVSSVDFEDGTKGTWSQSGNPTYGFVADGSKVLSVSNRVNSWDTISSPTGLLEAGTEYTLSMRVKLASGAAATQAHFTAADGSYSWIAPTPVNAAGWTTVTGKYTLPAGAAAATTKVSVEVDAVGGVLPSFFVDDILITKPAPAPVTPTVTTVSSVDFEDGTKGTWSQSGNPTYGYVADGSKVLSVSNRVNSWDTISSPTGLFEAGTEYTLSMRVKLASGAAATQAHFTAADGSYSWIAPTPVNAAGWTTVTGKYTLPAGAAAATTKVSVEVDAVGGVLPSFFVDDILITKPAAPVTPPAGSGTIGDVVVDAGFESGLEGWYGRDDGHGAPTTATTTTDKHTGAQSALVSNRVSQGQGLAHDTAGILVGGNRYDLSAYIKFAAGQTPGEVVLSYRADNSYGNLLHFENMSNSAWVHVTGQFVAPAKVDQLYFETVWANGAAGNTSAYMMDDITLTVTEPLAIEQGLTPIKDTTAFAVGAALGSTTKPYTDLLIKHFDQVTPENTMKPESWYGPDHTFVTTNSGADDLMTFAQANGTKVYGHVLVWHGQTPDWFFQKADGSYLTSSSADQQVMKDRMKAHIDNVAKYLSDKHGDFGSSTNPLYAFDVVNETVSDKADTPDGLRNSHWHDILGEQFIDLSFQYANEAFNSTYAAAGTTHPVTLFINDYNTELPDKQKRYHALIERLLARHVPLDGVGHQFHVSMSLPVSALGETLATFGALPLKQAVTELDVTTGTPVTEAKLVDQGYYYKSAFNAFRAFHARTGKLFSATVWGLTDNLSWRNTEGAPLLFGDDFKAKPAYYGVVDGSQLPTLTLTALAHAGDPVGTDAHDWSLLPNTQVGTGGSGFQVRWSADHLTAYVHVDDANNDGAGDKVALFTAGGSAVTVDRTGAGGTVAEVEGGYDVVATIPATGLAQGGTAQFDVRITDGGTGASVSWNDLTHHQEDGARLGALDLVEAVGYLAVPQVETAPTVDGDVDAVWADAPVVSTDTLVEGAAEGAKAKVRALWTDDALHLLYEVSDPTLDATSSNAWEQDSVETFLDPVNAKNGSYLPNDGQYRVNFENFQSVSGDLTVIGDRLTSATKVVDGGYVVEESIAFGRTAAVGDLTGVDFQVNDGTAGVRTAVHSWTDPTGRSYQNTTRWGVAELVGPLAPPVAAPQITQQPQSVSGAVASTVKLTAAASGYPVPTVRWEERSGASSHWRPVGTDSTTLSVKVSGKPDGDQYRAVFTNKLGSATSQVATVTVATSAPAITSQPKDASVKAKATAKFTVGVSGSPEPAVQWYQQAKGSTTWTKVPGGTSTTLSVVAQTSIDGTQYRALATSTAGTATSEAATLVVVRS
ncbi:endo-1,4-beta-xylanase [Cellulomonas sp. URHB0016]